MILLYKGLLRRASAPAVEPYLLLPCMLVSTLKFLNFNGLHICSAKQAKPEPAVVESNRSEP